MSVALAVLEALPSATDFYSQYWNKKPFIARGALDKEALADLIQGDELAGLAMEETPRSRMVKTAGKETDWTCAFGPFDEDDFVQAGEADWSLLVQNVEQFHPDTATLLKHFNFAPRWLMDDIMVSYSAPGGSVGPHIDSYHVFLVQGEGMRRWKVGYAPIEKEVYVEGIDLKVLKGGFNGNEVEMTAGDVLYLPPNFAHEGVTLKDAVTYSIGFLGPKLSELYMAYGQYLSEHEDLDVRFVGKGLTRQSSSFVMSADTLNGVSDAMSAPLTANDFNTWLVEFFTESSHEDFGHFTEREDALDAEAFAKALKGGGQLIKPAYVKLALTASQVECYSLGFDSHSFKVKAALLPLVKALMSEQAVEARLMESAEAQDLLRDLYNHEGLEFIEP